MELNFQSSGLQAERAHAGNRAGSDKSASGANLHINQSDGINKKNWRYYINLRNVLHCEPGLVL